MEILAGYIQQQEQIRLLNHQIQRQQQMHHLPLQMNFSDPIFNQLASSNPSLGAYFSRVKHGTRPGSECRSNRHRSTPEDAHYINYERPPRNRSNSSMGSANIRRNESRRPAPAPRHRSQNSSSSGREPKPMARLASLLLTSSDTTSTNNNNTSRNGSSNGTNGTNRSHPYREVYMEPTNSMPAAATRPTQFQLGSSVTSLNQDDEFDGRDIGDDDMSIGMEAQNYVDHHQ